MRFIRKHKRITILAGFIFILAFSSCGPGKKIKGNDCGCWSDNMEIKKEFDDQKQRG